jgi:hypothetical protein
MSTMSSANATTNATVSAAIRSMIYLGVDAHRESITTVVLPANAKTPTGVERLPNDLPGCPRATETSCLAMSAAA